MHSDVKHRVTLQRVSAAFAVVCITVVGASPSLAVASHRIGGTLNSSNSMRAPLRAAIASQVSSKYPIGNVDGSEPSGMSPPSSNALPGYKISYVTDFPGASLPAGWNAFSGSPGGDPGAQWAVSHTVVDNGLLQLNAWQDPAFNGQWVTGGVCQCGVPRTYGAYFVRSRATGPGPTQVELLWPTSGWPPEIDFNETYGGTDYSMATVHYTAANIETHRTVYVDMTQWHTWGLIWSPTSITYTVDGNVWGIVNDPAAIPNQMMTLHVQQQTWCQSGSACPTSPQTMQVDWVAEFAPTPPLTFAVSPFRANSTALSTDLKRQITVIAKRIKSLGSSNVSLFGYGDFGSTVAKWSKVSRARAVAVERYLRTRLAAIGVSSVTIAASVRGSPNPVVSMEPSTNVLTSRGVIASVT